RQCGKAMPPPRVRITQPQQSLSPFAPDPFSGQQTDDKRGWQPDAGRAREPLMGGFGDFFNESTGQLLPDTLDVKPPAAFERLQGAVERNSNGSAGASAHLRPEFPDQASDISSGEFASTDELEMDKTLDKTVETPALVLPQDRNEDRSGEASAAGFSLNNH